MNTRHRKYLAFFPHSWFGSVIMAVL